MSLDVTAFTGLGPGIHDVIVTDLSKKAAKAGGDYLRWEFTGKDGKTESANSSVEMTPGNKTGKWFAALTGRPTVVGERREMSEVIGKACTIVSELNPDGYPKVIALTGRQAAGRSRPSPVETMTADDQKPDIEAVDAATEVADSLPF